MQSRILELSAIITNYTSLEEQLIEFIEFLPYTDETKLVASPKFTPLILEACSLIDSTIRDFDGNHKNKDIKQLIKDTDEYLDLYNTVSMFLIPNYTFLNPFALAKDKMPSWWNAYNLIKHDRLKNYKLATYETCILSVCALHQVIYRDPDLIPILISKGWFNTASEDIDKVIFAQHVGKNVRPIGIIPVESKLFISPLTTNFAEYINGNYNVNEQCQISSKACAIISAQECIDSQ